VAAGGATFTVKFDAFTRERWRPSGQFGKPVYLCGAGVMAHRAIDPARAIGGSLDRVMNLIALVEKRLSAQSRKHRHLLDPRQSFASQTIGSDDLRLLRCTSIRTPKGEREASKEPSPIRGGVLEPETFSPGSRVIFSAP
jgi:hypothetical protein